MNTSLKSHGRQGDEAQSIYFSEPIRRESQSLVALAAMGEMVKCCSGSRSGTGAGITPRLRTDITMHTYKNNRNSKRSGFTLIEMVGVLAIIAVLAGLLLPRIFAAINEARVNSAALGVNSLKSSSMSYFAKYGKFAGATGGIPTAAEKTNWASEVLLKGGFIEKPFATRMSGTSSAIYLLDVDTTTGPITDVELGSFDLDGDLNNDLTLGNKAVVAELTEVALDDARELNDKVDGDGVTLGEVSTGKDLKGRVKYDFGSAQVGTVYVYVAHK